GHDPERGERAVAVARGVAGPAAVPPARGEARRGRPRGGAGGAARRPETPIPPGGETADREVKPLTTAVLRGLLERSAEGVNYVNAPAMARDRGIRVVQSKRPPAGASRTAIGVKVDTAAGSTRVAGAVFDADTIRVTQINDFKLEAVPEGYVLLLHNQDVPGVVGRVGTLLGENGINIAGLELCREHVGGLALSLFHVDDPVPDAVLEALRTHPN